MEESIREVLAREAEEAEAVADAQTGDSGGQRGRRSAVDPSQVYSVRIPVHRLEELRALAVERGVAPTSLLRQFVLERLDREAAPVQVTALPLRDPDELRIGPSRTAPMADVLDLSERQAL